MGKMLDRREFLGAMCGRTYQIDIEDEREIIYFKSFQDLDPFEQEDDINNTIDMLADGMNQLEKIDGQWYEICTGRTLYVRRKAYNVSD